MASQAPPHHRHVAPAAIDRALDYDAMRRGGVEAAWEWLAITECEQCWSLFNRSRWQRSGPSPEIDELSQYLGPKFEPGRDGTLALADLWRSLDPVTPDEIAAFYRGADDYLYDLALFHASGERRDYASDLAEIASHYGCLSALDYGCGIGSDGLSLIRGGLDVVFMDYRGPLTDYLAWRLERRALAARLIHFVGEGSVPEADLVFALDVFEHLPEPETMAEVLARRTRKVLVYNVLFRVDSDTICPMHLPDHDPVATAHAIEDRLRGLGLTCRADDPLLTVWTR
jgi:hypothetical protein